MSDRPKILAFAGSLRSGSYNKKMIRVAAQLARDAGAAVTEVDLRDLDLPIYDGDFEDEHGLPNGAKQLKQLMKASDGFLIAAPEYNSSLSAALKNAIDWASRPAEDSTPLEAFKGKVAGIMAASPGALGGLRGLFQLRFVLGNINVLVVPEQFAMSKANEAFNDDGTLQDDAHLEKIRTIVQRVIDVTAALK